MYSYAKIPKDADPAQFSTRFGMSELYAAKAIEERHSLEKSQEKQIEVYWEREWHWGPIYAFMEELRRTLASDEVTLDKKELAVRLHVDTTAIDQWLKWATIDSGHWYRLERQPV